MLMPYHVADCCTSTDSDGVTLKDNNARTTEPQCAHFMGPWVRFAVARRTSLSGYSNVSAEYKSCANMTLLISDTNGGNGASNDVIFEQTQFSCPAGGHGGVYKMNGCKNCVAGHKTQ